MLDNLLLTSLIEHNDLAKASKYLQKNQKRLSYNQLLSLRVLFKKELKELVKNPLKVAILRTYTVEPMMPCFEVLCKIAGFEPSVYLAGYGQVFQEILNEQGALYKNNPDIIFIFLRLEDMWPEVVHNFLSLSPQELQEVSDRVIKDVTTLITGIRKHTHSSVVLSNFILPSYSALGIYDINSPQSQSYFIERLNASVADVVRRYPNCYLMNLNQLASRLGKKTFFDSRMYYISKAPYSRGGFLAISREMLKFIKIIKGQTRKCIVVDCDNTLWGGIIGEDGIDGIKLSTEYPGACYREFQRQLLSLLEKGFLLAINSNNNKDDVLEVLNKHPYQLLREEHFACIKVNWEDKLSNMRAIADELNLGIDSFVYLDDDSAQCKLIEDNLPEVLTIQVPSEPLEITSLLEDIDELEILSLTVEDRERPKLYSQEARRKQLKTSATSLEDFYASLQMEMDVFHNPSGHVARLAQMTQRTNQFNLTTRRYSEAEIRNLIDSGVGEVYAFSLRDIFGDSGLVGEAIFKKLDDSTYEIDTLLMSCRVIGRTAEESFIMHCLKKLQKRGVRKLIARFIPTRKNALVQDFYEKMGFEVVSQFENGEKIYNLDLSSMIIPPSKWIKINDIE